MKKCLNYFIDFSGLAIAFLFISLCFLVEVKIFASEKLSASNIQKAYYNYNDLGIYYMEFTVDDSQSSMILRALKESQPEITQAIDKMLYRLRYYPATNAIELFSGSIPAEMSAENKEVVMRLLEANEDLKPILQEFFCEVWGPLATGTEWHVLNGDDVVMRSTDSSLSYFSTEANQDTLSVSLQPDYRLESKTIENPREHSKVFRKYSFVKVDKKYLLAGFKEFTKKDTRFSDVSFDISYQKIDGYYIPEKIERSARYSNSILTLELSSPKIVRTVTAAL